MITISMKDIKYKAKKKARAETDLKSIVLQVYFNFLIFSQKKTQNKYMHILSLNIYFWHDHQLCQTKPSFELRVLLATNFL